MTDRERFYKIYKGEKVDRIPLYFFGTWRETKIRWREEGLHIPDEDMDVDYGPQLTGMDIDWEKDMWNCHGLVNIYPYAPGETVTEYEDENSFIVKYPTGAKIQYLKGQVTIPHTVEFALKPNRQSWDRFKTYLNFEDSWRHPKNQIEMAKAYAKRDNLGAFMGASLYGWLRDWLGVEELSCLMYDDEELFGEMIDFLTDYFINVHKGFLKYAQFDFVYIFEDCCGSSGPLISPYLYTKFFDKNYKKLVKFFKEEASVPYVLLDSDGFCDVLIPLWIESGIDIIFPLEVGTWKQTPSKVRSKFGKDLKILGGINKFMMLKEKSELRDYLLTLKQDVEHGYFIPIPDHRVPPEVSLEKMKDYIEVFNEVFNKT